MKIGISTAVKTKKEYWEKVQFFINLNYKYIELYNKAICIRYKDIKHFKKLSGIQFSFHSACQDLFCQDKIIAQTEVARLKGELRFAYLSGVKNFIFHINKKTPLNNSEIKILKSILKTARSYKINLCLENNNCQGAFSGDYLIKILEKIPKLCLCLDFGHLKMALYRKEIIDLDNFLTQTKNQIIQMHIHSNNNKKDRHLAIKKQDLILLNKIINKINNKKLTLIIETKSISQADKTKKLLNKLK